MKKYFRNFYKYRYLLYEIVRKNIKLQYRDSFLGILWTFLQPLLTTIVLVVVFGNLLGKDSSKVLNYPVYLLCGRLLYDFYSQSTKRAMRSIKNSASVIKKVYVPKYMYPLANVLSTFVTFLISLIVLVLFIAYFLIFSPNKPNVTPYVYDVFCMLLFYVTPIVYSIEQLKIKNVWAMRIFMANPLYSIVSMFRDCVLFGRMINIHHLLYALCFSVVTLAVGIIVFAKKQDKFILHI